MPLTAIASIAALTTGTVAVIATGVLLVQPQASEGPDVWFDYPVAAGTIYAGPVVVSAHTNEPKATAIVLEFAKDGKVVTSLTDSELEASGVGPGADILLTASSDWDAPVGEYAVTAKVYRGASVVHEEKSTLTVVGFKPSGIGLPGPKPGDTTSPEPSLEPTTTASPSASPSPTASGTTDPSPEPSSTEPPQTTPTPEPTTSNPEPSVTPEPPPPALAGKVTRSNESNYGWTNTFTVTGFRPQGAQVFVDINLHNTMTKPYYAGYKSYPCGSPTLYSGSGTSATYQCVVTVTIEPNGNWYSGEYWWAMDGNVFRSKVITGGKTLYGTGGNWNVFAKPR